MKSTFGEIVTEVLKHEGGYVDDALDKGGQTKYGISKRAHPDVEIKDLTVEDAISIYREHYWKPSKAERLPEKLRAAYFLFLVKTVNLLGFLCTEVTFPSLSRINLAAVNSLPLPSRSKVS